MSKYELIYFDRLEEELELVEISFFLFLYFLLKFFFYLVSQLGYVSSDKTGLLNDLLNHKIVDLKFIERYNSNIREKYRCHRYNFESLRN